MMLLGTPPVLSTEPRSTPLSTPTFKAIFVKCVCTGGLASVDGTSDVENCDLGEDALGLGEVPRGVFIVARRLLTPVPPPVGDCIPPVSCGPAVDFLWMSNFSKIRAA